MDNTEKLVFGKAGVKGVVGLEVADDTAEVFVQDKDGGISSVFVSNRFWILSNKNLNGKFAKLKGDLHYNWGTQFKDRATWSKCRGAWKKSDDIYTIWSEQEALMTKDGICYYQGLNPKDVSVLSFDLETTGLDPSNENAKIVLISNTFRSLKGKETKLFSYDEYETEADMLLDWCQWICDKDPSILTGHNIFGFDIRYLLGRADSCGITLNIGRDGSALTPHEYTSSFRIDGSRDMEFTNVKCYGREVIDTMFLSYRYDAVKKKYDSYGLKSIIKTEGLEKEGRTFYDASQIRYKYKDPEEMKKIKEYCIDDADDALALFDLMCPAYFYQSQSTTRSFQHLHISATGALINGILVRSYLQEGHSIPKADQLEKLEGGISFAIPGVYRNLVKIDLKSAYPSQVLRFKLFDKSKDPEGNFYKLVKYFTEQRFHYKKMNKQTGDKKWEDLDASGKIFINSAYGACSTNGLNFNSPEVAAKITLETRNVIDLALKWSSGRGKDYWMDLFKSITKGETEDESV